MMVIRKATKAETVYQRLKQQISDGMYADGVLPVEPELALQLEVSRKTLRSALTRLALENRIVRIKGEGTFINRNEGPQDKILVLIRDQEDITNPDRYILPGIQQQAAAMNLQVETCTGLSFTAGPIESAVRRIRRNRYSGVLSMHSSFNGDEPIIRILEQTGLPVLLPHAFRRDAERTPFAVMGTDYRQVVRDGLQYLVRLGHRRIGYLAYHESRITRSDYFSLLDELGLVGSSDLYIKSTSYRHHDKIIETIDKLFSRPKPQQPTAVLCFSDYFALCLYEYLERHQLRIPDDVSVLSIGGMIGCDFFNPPLSALDFNCIAIGRLAVRTLMEMKMNHELTRPFAITPHYLAERESTRKIDHKEPRP